MTIEQAYQSGYAHGRAGSKGTCPCTAGTPERAAWMNGYYEGLKYYRYS